MATAQVLPKELRLSAPPTMPQARSYMFKQQSQNASYTSGSASSIQINIPRLQRSYLSKDSYLRFRLELPNFTVGSTSGLYLDTCGAFGFFDKIEIYDYLGSTLLESTGGHAQLLSTLMDISCSPTETGLHYGLTTGTGNGGILADADRGALDIASGIGATYSATTTVTGIKATQYGSQHGQLLASANITSTAYWEFAIPLFSFLGSLSGKFAPLHNGFTIVLYLNSLNNVFGAATATGGAGSAVMPTSYTLSNVFMCCQILELGPQAEAMLMNSAGGKPLVIPAKAFRNYADTMPAGASGATVSRKIDLNLNVASLTNILWIFRPDAFTTTTPYLFKATGQRTRNYLSNWYFQYGSSILPQTTGIQAQATTVTVNNGGHDECYYELMKSRHALNQANFSTQISRQSYTLDVTTATISALSGANISQHGRFAAGLDLELVSGRSQNLICGMNTNGMNTAIFMTFTPGTGNTVAAGRFDVWAEYDAFINISPGIATTVSF